MEIIVELPNGDKKSIKYLNKDDKVSKLRNEIKINLISIFKIMVFISIYIL